jgi:GntR family transcriptional regulator/MocR family aminotransferase
VPVQLHVDFEPGRDGLQTAVYDAVRRYIFSGELKGGSRLPSSRELAAHLGVSRNTVTLAYERLAGEDLVEGRERSGLFVRHLGTLPLDDPARESLRGTFQPSIARLQQLYSYVGAADRLRPLAVGTPALDHFPLAQWSRLARRRLRSMDTRSFGYGDPLGYCALREAICDHLAVSRGIRCCPDHVLICAGAQAGLYLCSLVFCGPGGQAWVEDPGYGGAVRAVAVARGEAVAVPVDSAGLNVKSGLRLAADARLAVVTPSNQFPTGVAMTVDRRLELLAWSERHDAWICEDDYDSEFRFDGRPLTSLHALGRERGSRRVIYCGSFSKTLFPALKIGYLVLPAETVDAFVAVRAMIGREPPWFEQAVLADFIREGHYGRHLRRMRRLYAGRAAALQKVVAQHLAGRLEMTPVSGGLQAFARLMAGERRDAWQAALSEIGAMPDVARADGGTRDALVMGFANMAPKLIDEVVCALARSSHLAG